MVAFMSNKKTVIYIVRHGQSEASGHGVYGTDASLTQKGYQQAKDASKVFEEIDIDKIFASNLQRAQQTAAVIAQKHNLLVETTVGLQEPFYGQLEGKSRKQAKEEFNERFIMREALTDEERMKFKIVPDMESDAEALNRFLSALILLVKANPQRTILIISHVPLMKLLLIHLGYATRKQLKGESIENGGYIKLKSDGEQFDVIETHGIHLKEV